MPLPRRRQPARRHYNPFFIYGGVGPGKRTSSTPSATGKRPCFDSSVLPQLESFMNERSPRYDATDGQFSRFRNVDVLILDDVQFLAGEKNPRKFFHIQFTP
jgi:chromosomal replication initiator protein